MFKPIISVTGNIMILNIRQWYILKPRGYVL